MFNHAIPINSLLVVTRPRSNVTTIATTQTKNPTLCVVTRPRSNVTTMLRGFTSADAMSCNSS